MIYNIVHTLSKSEYAGHSKSMQSLEICKRVTQRITADRKGYARQQIRPNLYFSMVLSAVELSKSLRKMISLRVCKTSRANEYPCEYAGVSTPQVNA